MTGAPPTLFVTDDLGEEKDIEDTTYTRILGTNLQNNLRWNAYMETGKKSLLPQCRRLIGKLRHNSSLIPMRSRRNIINGLLISKLKYLMPLWGSAAESHINKAQILLNTAARWVTGLGKKTKIRSLMEAADWLSIREQVLVSVLGKGSEKKKCGPGAHFGGGGGVWKNICRSTILL